MHLYEFTCIVPGVGRDFSKWLSNEGISGFSFTEKWGFWQFFLKKRLLYNLLDILVYFDFFWTVENNRGKIKRDGINKVKGVAFFSSFKFIVHPDSPDSFPFLLPPFFWSFSCFKGSSNTLFLSWKWLGLLAWCFLSLLLLLV